MGSNRKLWNIVVVVAFCLVAVWFSTSWGQGRGGYQPETHVYTTPEYQTDTTRAISAYERLMERYMDMTERSLGAISTDVAKMTVKLDAMEADLTSLDARLARIEQHLGIVTATRPTTDPNAPAGVHQGPKPLTPPGPVPAR